MSNTDEPMPMNISELTAAQIVQHIAAGELTATDCTQHFLDAIKQRDPDVNSFLHVADETALAAAAQIDQRRVAGEKLGPLAGLPVAIKDGICTKDIRTTAASKMLETFVPPFDATIVKKLVDAEAIVIGKTNLDEFAMGSSTENSAFGATKNPWNHDCVPGGSSGGSAACVAADLAPVSIGSDTGGSIRQPASFCGVTGLKPTYGRVSRFGLIAFASSLDQIGPFTRTAQDAALTMQAIGGHCDKDSTSAREELPDFSAKLDQPLKGIRIGLCKEHFESSLPDDVRASVDESIEVLKSLGATTVEITLPHSSYGIAAYYVIASSEASGNLARFDGVRYTMREAADNLNNMYGLTRTSGFGDEVRRRIMLGTYALSSGYYDAYYVKASKIRRLIKNDYDTAFAECDVILGPTAPTPAFKFGEHTTDPLTMYLADIFTVTTNLAGLPGISIPCGFSDGLPIGLQLQGKSFDEATLLQIAHQFQQQTDWHTRRPQA
jgi:aspartyl-tRNA(Asn)/glutamyl-tRNA(Gln) amidotransferase subunit A